MIARGDSYESVNRRVENDKIIFAGIDKQADYIIDSSKTDNRQEALEIILNILKQEAQT